MARRVLGEDYHPEGGTMDPTICLRELLSAIAIGDKEAAAYAADDLADWLTGGGFLPTVEILGPKDLRYPDENRVRLAV